MNLNHLLAFIKVVQANSFKAAAKQLSISQPAVSMRVQSLEDYFGKKLIIRLSDGVQLTRAGEAAYEQIQTILYEWEQLEHKLKGNEMSGIIKLGASTIPSEYLVPNLLSKFKKQFPVIQVNTAVAGSHDVINWLADGTVDVIITGKQKIDKNIFSTEIFEDELVLIIPPKADAHKLTTNLDDLVKLDWILREQGSNTRKVWESVLQKHNLIDEVNVVAQMGSNEAVIGAVEAGLGVSVVSSLAANRAAHHGRVKIVPNENFSVKRPFYLATLKENLKHPLIKSFVDFVEG